MPSNPKDGLLQVRTVRFLPQDVETEPSFPQDLKIKPELLVVLSNLFGQTTDGGRLISAFSWNALKVSQYGTGFQVYDTKADTQPASFSSTHQLLSASGLWHRVDIFVESEEAEIRFYMDSSQLWGDAIPLNVGYHSIEFSTSNVQIRKRGATAGTYTLVAFQ